MQNSAATRPLPPRPCAVHDKRLTGIESRLDAHADLLVDVKGELASLASDQRDATQRIEGQIDLLVRHLKPENDLTIETKWGKIKGKAPWVLLAALPVAAGAIAVARGLF